MFSGLAARYDLFNAVAGLGMAGRWRRAVTDRLSPGQRVLDIGAGTGALAVQAARRVGPSGSVDGIDLSDAMLAAAARRRAGAPVTWTRASAARLPFPDSRFDSVVSSFVWRNLVEGGVAREALREAFRVLKPGGQVLFLDLTTPRGKIRRLLHGFHVRTVMSLAGRVLFGDRWPGAYLRRTVEQLGGAERLVPLLGEAGFRDASVTPLSAGVVSLITARKER
jgi:demethylmenaquinone methyltransferase / 2-methoxy-6-polyprenyl-1,4-benzoquinol methylase